MTWQWPQQQQQQLQQLLLRPEPHYPPPPQKTIRMVIFQAFECIRMHSNVFAIFHSSWQSSFECSIRMEAVPFQTLESVLRMHSSFRMFVEEWEYEWIPFLGIPIPRTCGPLYQLARVSVRIVSVRTNRTRFPWVRTIRTIVRIPYESYR